MRIGWMGIVAQISENFSNVHQVICPNCGEMRRYVVVHCFSMIPEAS